jgi:hypothetical protein
VDECNLIRHIIAEIIANYMFEWWWGICPTEVAKTVIRNIIEIVLILFDYNT